jgi:hypothetical protein
MDHRNGTAPRPEMFSDVMQRMDGAMLDHDRKIMRDLPCPIERCHPAVQSYVRTRDETHASYVMGTVRYAMSDGAKRCASYREVMQDPRVEMFLATHPDSTVITDLVRARDSIPKEQRAWLADAMPSGYERARIMESIQDPSTGPMPQ